MKRVSNACGNRVDSYSKTPLHVVSSRRIALVTSLLMPLDIAAAQALPQLQNKETDDSKSPYIQGLVKKSAENRERYQKERLQDYYRRNFKEYFEFESGSQRTADARGISAENQAAIAKWLKDNK